MSFIFAFTVIFFETITFNIWFVKQVPHKAFSGLFVHHTKSHEFIWKRIKHNLDLHNKTNEFNPPKNVLITITFNLFSDISDVQEFCQNEAFSAKCSNNEVIIMEKALYGRMRLGRCVKTDFGFVGCYTDVLKVSQKVPFSHL